MLRTKDIGRVRLTSSTFQTCTVKSIIVFFEVAYKESVFFFVLLFFVPYFYVIKIDFYGYILDP